MKTQWVNRPDEFVTWLSGTFVVLTDFIEAMIPVDKIGHAFLNSNAWLITYGILQAFHRSLRTWHISGLKGEHFLFGFSAQAVFEHFDVAEQFYGLLVADVENLIWADSAGCGIRTDGF